MLPDEHQYAPGTPPKKVLQVASPEVQSGSSKATKPGKRPQGGHPQTEASIKAQWRQCLNLDDFADLAGLRSGILAFLRVQYDEECDATGASVELPPFLVTQAASYISQVQHELQREGVGSNEVSFMRLPLTHEAEDEGIFIFTELLKISAFFHFQKKGDYLALFRRFLPKQKAAPRGHNLVKGMTSAFHQPPFAERDVAGTLKEVICRYFGEFNSLTHFAPYTSLVGPGGIGKTYALQSLAKDANVYVVYCNLSKRSDTVYPPGNGLLLSLVEFFHQDREQMTIFWECYLALSILLVKICRRNRVSPGTFFDLQVKGEFLHFQGKLAQHSKDLFDLVIEHGIPKNGLGRRERSGDHGVHGNFDYQNYVNRRLPGIETAAAKTFRGVLDVLRSPEASDKSVDTRAYMPAPDAPTVIAFDEARELSYRGDLTKFLALRRAMRHRSKTSPGADGDRKEFFGLLLDTSAQVSDFSPPVDRDPSAKIPYVPQPLDDSDISTLNARVLFPPIYEIDTVDALAPESLKRPVAPVDKNRDAARAVAQDLFCLGRPVWGSLLKHMNFGQVLDYARQKIHGEWGPERTRVFGFTDAMYLAWVSYRINFYVVMPVLAETMTSGFLRFITGINDERTFMRTTHPSEPILAFCSALATRQNGKARLEMVKAFHRNIVNGFIHVGDVGEAIAALTLLFAYDRKMNTAYPEPIRVREFFTPLFPSHDEFKRELEDCTGTSRHMKTLWDEGLVFFNHFVRLNEAPTMVTLHQAYRRGVALLPPFGWKGADMVIPIGLPEDKMSYVVVQVKNRKNDILSRGLKNEARDALKSAADGLGDRDHIAVMMSLRGKGGQEGVELVQPPVRQETVRRNRPGPFKINYDWEQPKRLLIVAVGMSLDVYPGIGLQDKPQDEPVTRQIVETFKNLLGYTTAVDASAHGLYYEHLSPLG